MAEEEKITPTPAQKPEQASTQPAAPIIIQSKQEDFQAIGQEVKEWLENEGINTQPEVVLMKNEQTGVSVELHSCKMGIVDLTNLAGQAYCYTMDRTKETRDPGRSGVS